VLAEFTERDRSTSFEIVYGAKLARSWRGLLVLSARTIRFGSDVAEHQHHPEPHELTKVVGAAWHS
jgi:hypothetical protein